MKNLKELKMELAVKLLNDEVSLLNLVLSINEIEPILKNIGLYENNNKNRKLINMDTLQYYSCEDTWLCIPEIGPIESIDNEAAFEILAQDIDNIVNKFIIYFEDIKDKLVINENIKNLME